MAVPKSKISRSRRNMRRAHDAISADAYSVCANCGEMHRPHHACSHCGFYRHKGNSVIEIPVKEA